MSFPVDPGISKCSVELLLKSVLSINHGTGGVSYVLKGSNPFSLTECLQRRIFSERVPEMGRRVDKMDAGYGSCVSLLALL